MKRDIDLVRAILIDVERSEEPMGMDLPALSDWPQPIVGYHVKIMIEAGLLHGANITGDGDVGYNFGGLQLTWAGHDFLDSARNDDVWQKAKTAMGKVGGFVFEVGRALLIEYAKQEVGLS